MFLTMCHKRDTRSVGLVHTYNMHCTIVCLITHLNTLHHMQCIAMCTVKTTKVVNTM